MSEADVHIAQKNAGYVREVRNSAIAFLVLDTTFVALRFLARTVKKQAGFGWDDWLIIPALIAGIGVCVSGIDIAHWTGVAFTPNHSQLEALKAVENTFHGIFVLQIVYVFAFSFSKLSIVAMYLRIFTTKKTRMICWGLIVFLVANCISYVIAAILICRPVSAFWDRSIVTAKCYDYQAFDRSIPGPNVVSDLIMLVLPLPTIWGLNASVTKRLGIAFTLLTGSVGLVACCVRWAFFLKYSIHSQSEQQQSAILVWTEIEAGMYLIAACLPPLRGLLNVVGDEWIGSTFSTLFRSGRRTLGSDVPMDSFKREQRQDNASFSRLVNGPDEGVTNGTATAAARTSQHEAMLEQGLKGGTIGVKKDVWVE